MRASCRTPRARKTVRRRPTTGRIRPARSQPLRLEAAFPFMSLPVKLRWRIYTELLVDEDHAGLRITGHKAYHYGRLSKKLYPQIMAASSQVYAEARRVLYSNNNFRFPDFADDTEYDNVFVDSIGIPNREYPQKKREKAASRAETLLNTISSFDRGLIRDFEIHFSRWTPSRIQEAQAGTLGFGTMAPSAIVLALGRNVPRCKLDLGTCGLRALLKAPQEGRLWSSFQDWCEPLQNLRDCVEVNMCTQYQGDAVRRTESESISSLMLELINKEYLVSVVGTVEGEDAKLYAQKADRAFEALLDCASGWHKFDGELWPRWSDMYYDDAQGQATNVG